MSWIGPVRSGLLRYREPFHVPGSLRAWLLALPGRLPVGANALALVLMGQAAFGQLGHGALLAGVFVVANAIGALVQGRLIDAYGPVRVVASAGVLHSLGLLVIVMMVAIGRLEVALAFAVVAGAALPQLSASVRSMWAQELADDGRLRTAFALETVVIEVTRIVGPLLVAAAFVVDHRLAVVASAILAAMGSVGFALSRAAQRMRARGYVRPGVGFLVSGPVVASLAVVLLVGFMIGGMEVSLVSYSGARSAVASAGVYLACFAVGSVLGGLLFGGLSTTGVPANQVVVLALADAVTLALLALSPPPLITAALVFLLGGSAAPLYTVLSLSLDRLSSGSSAEAYTIFVTSFLAGSGGGTTIGGFVAEAAGSAGGFLLCAAAMGIAAVVALVTRKRLSAGSSQTLPPADVR